MIRSIVLLSLYGIVQIIGGFYNATLDDTPASFTVLHFAILLWGTGMWLEQDNKKYRVDWVFDMGMLLYVAWPLVMPIYLYKTRGIKAYKPIVVFVAVYVIGTAIGYMIGSVL